MESYSRWVMGQGGKEKDRVCVYAGNSALSHTWTLLQAAAYHLMLVRIARAYHHQGHCPPYSSDRDLHGSNQAITAIASAVLPLNPRTALRAPTPAENPAVLLPRAAPHTQTPGRTVCSARCAPHSHISLSLRFPSFPSARSLNFPSASAMRCSDSHCSHFT